jgi:outer membrane lipoprotein carrier protein
MVNRRIVGSVLCLLFIVVSVEAWAQDLSTIINRVQEEYDRTQDIQAAFTQIALVKSVGRKQQSQGVVYFKKPGKMRWEYTNPEQQLLVSDGKTMWFYVAEDGQVIIQNAEDAYGSKTPITFLSGMGKLQNDFYMKLLPASEGVTVYKLELLPKQPQPDLAKLILSVEPTTYRIVHTAVYDPYGNITDVFLNDIQANAMLPDELFTFEIPEGVDVIQQN